MLKKSTLFLFFIAVVISVNAQKKKNSKVIDLRTVLVELEATYNVKFSYNSSLIKNLFVDPFTSESTLKEKLQFLSNNTNLLLSQIDNRYIIIKEKPVTKNHTVCGILLNNKTQEPVAFSSIIVNNTLRGTTTDESGKFTLKNVNSNQKITIKTIGYKTTLVPVFMFLNKNCLTIYVDEENIELEEVLISDYITQGVTKKQNGAIEVSPNKLGILPGLIEPDVLLSLQLLPGIQSPNETASGLQIRGSSPDQNLVLFDGIKMYQSGHFFGLISSFNPYVTKNISVFRSGTEARFGDRIGGVLDISSGDDVPNFESGFGVNLTHADVFIKTPLLNDKVGLVFSARRSITDWVETITYKNFSESVFQNTRIFEGLQEQTRLTNVNNDFYFKDYNLKVVADISDRSKISLSNLFNKNQLEYSSDNDRFREKSTDFIAYQNKGTRINWNYHFLDNFSQNIDFHNSEYDFEYLGKRQQQRNDPNNNNNKEFEVKNSVKDVGFNYDLTYNFSKKFQLNSGYQYSNTKVYYLFQNNFNNNQNKLLSDENSRNKTQALFSEIKFNNAKTFFSLGLRANHFSAVDSWFFEPRLFASTYISDQIMLKTSAEVKNQAVSQIIEHRNNGVGLENNVWAVANSQIPILKSEQLSAGFLYRNNGWNFDVDFYKKKIKGLTLMTEDIASQKLPYVTGESDIFGIDVLLKKRYGNYRSWISYSYSNIKQQFNTLNSGNSFDGIDEIPHSFTWSHTYKINQLELSLGWIMRSGVPYTTATGTYLDNNNNLRISYGKVNEKRLPNYQKLDFSSTYSFNFSKNKNIKGKIGLSLLNVFNKKNILNRTYELKIVNNSGNIEEQKIVETDKVSLGFTPNVVFRITF
jgi:hypothetical protein